MAQVNLHDQYLRVYLLFMVLRTLTNPELTPEEAALLLDCDISCILLIRQTRYLQGRSPVAKAGNIHLAWEFALNPSDHHRFVNMLRVSPDVFLVLLDLIEDHPIFQNDSNNAQAPVQVQLAVTLYRMGHYGNGASLEDIARFAGVSEGSVENFTEQCFTAIESLHDAFVRLPTREEKEAEKCWVDQRVGFQGTWREGWVMYDGTIVVLYAKPGLNGDAYFTRKANYGLNLQVSGCFFGGEADYILNHR
jgi:hypothetical protein